MKISIEEKNCPYYYVKDSSVKCKKTGKICCRIYCPYANEDDDNGYDSREY